MFLPEQGGNIELLTQLYWPTVHPAMQEERQMADSYDASRMANFGRDAARAYATLRRAHERMAVEVNAALESGITPLKIAHDLMGRCSSHEARVDLLSIIRALVELEKIPKTVYDPFEKGIRPRRI